MARGLTFMSRINLKSVFFGQRPTFFSGYKLIRLSPNSLFGRIVANHFAGEIVEPNGCDRLKSGTKSLV